MSVDQAGFLALLRRIEQANPGKPPIGRSERIGDEAVRLGQDAELGFPTSELAHPARRRSALPELRARFIGLFGPNGALPLNTTEEVARWQARGEDAFTRFADIFSERFYQLFFRAWSDNHAISQFDHPARDRFGRYVAALAGVGSDACRGRDDFPDIARLPLVALFGGRVRSPIRLQQMLAIYFGIPVEVEEHVPAWMEFESEDRTALGRNAAILGRSAYLGARVRSVGETLRLHLRLPDLAQYRSFLPGGANHVQLGNLVFWYLGRSYDVDLALLLPGDAIPPAQLGRSAELGWMAALPGAAGAADQDGYVAASCFALRLDGAPSRAPLDDWTGQGG